jgi:alkylhydroperoxidase/carboxymuconolactone decarboxylase family protein YurZ
MAAEPKSLNEIANRISDERRSMEEILLKHSSVYPVLVQQMEKVYGDEKKKDGLDQVHKMLIAVAMAVQTGSESSVEWTITRAVNHGASDQMIRDAVDVALLNGGTFSVANARFAYAATSLRRVAPRKSKIIE